MNGYPFCLLLSRQFPPEVEARATRLFRVVQAASLPKPDSDLASLSRQAAADALLICAADRLSSAQIEALPDSVKIIATFSVGYEHIAIEAAQRRGIAVTNTPDVVTDATADIALLLILTACRRAHEGQSLLRSGTWDGWTPTQLLGQHLGGRRLALLGMGRIGQATAQRARAFGLQIHYHNRTRLPAEREQNAIFHPTPNSLLRIADILSLHAPASPQTDRFLNRDRIALLPADAVVINTARGSLIEDDALIEALQTGRVWAAGLDVFDNEPKLDPRYRTLPNVFLLPHLGTATVETRNAMGFRALDNLEAFFSGQDLRDRVI